jgi:hypothetical protein
MDYQKHVVKNKPLRKSCEVKKEYRKWTHHKHSGLVNFADLRHGNTRVAKHQLRDWGIYS